MTTSVCFRDVSVSFSGHMALRNIDVSFPVGRISVLTGRSGSGKTTLLRSVNRLNEEFPGCMTSGGVFLDLGDGERDIYAHGLNENFFLPELRRRVGMLFQTPNLFPVSILQNIVMPLKIVAGLPGPAAEEAARIGLESVGLWKELKDRLRKPAATLSGGQQQRLCLARLLALSPAVLLLDEPTAFLDAHAAREIEELLQSLAPRYTIIMVSHGLAQARRVAEQILVCEHGAISKVVKVDESLAETALAELL